MAKLLQFKLLANAIIPRSCILIAMDYYFRQFMQVRTIVIYLSMELSWLIAYGTIQFFCFVFTMRTVMQGKSTYYINITYPIVIIIQALCQILSELKKEKEKKIIIGLENKIKKNSLA